MADWVTISSLASALGTLVLAFVTVASVRSANRAARVAELSLLVALRPLLVAVPPRRPAAEGRLTRPRLARTRRGGQGGRPSTADDAVYLAISVRDVGSGIAVLHGWAFFPRCRARPRRAPDPARRLSRAAHARPLRRSGDVGFWQGTLRDTSLSRVRRRADRDRDAPPLARPTSSTATSRAASARSAASCSHRLAGRTGVRGSPRRAPLERRPPAASARRRS